MNKNNSNLELIIALSGDDLSEVHKLRYRSYRSVNAIPVNKTEKFSDAFDDAPNTTTFLLRKPGHRPVSSIRACIQIGLRSDVTVPAWPIYRRDIIQAVGSQAIIIEPNRFVTEPNMTKSNNWACASIFIGIALAAEANECSHILTAVRPGHLPFYKRFFGMRPISRLHTYHGINAEMILMAADQSSFRQRNLTRLSENCGFDQEKMLKQLSALRCESIEYS